MRGYAYCSKITKARAQREIMALAKPAVYTSHFSIVMVPPAALTPGVDHRAGRHHQAAGRGIPEGSCEVAGEVFA